MHGVAFEYVYVVKFSEQLYVNPLRYMRKKFGQTSCDHNKFWMLYSFLAGEQINLYKMSMSQNIYNLPMPT